MGEKEKWTKKSASLKAKYEKDIAAYEKSARHKSYMAEKAKYNEARDAKRGRSESAGAGGKKKKVKRSASKSKSAKRRASVPKAAKKKSRSVSRKKAGKKAA